MPTKVVSKKPGAKNGNPDVYTIKKPVMQEVDVTITVDEQTAVVNNKQLQLERAKQHVAKIEAELAIEQEILETLNTYGG